MTSVPSRIHLISRTFVAAAAVFGCIGFASSAFAVTLSKGRRIPVFGPEVIGAVASDRGVLITSVQDGIPDQIRFDFVPLVGETTRSTLVTPPLYYFVATGGNGRGFLTVYPDAGQPKAILLDSVGAPIQTVILPAIAPWLVAPVVLAASEGFDVYAAQGNNVLRTSVHLDGTASGTWQTVATFAKEIGFLDVVNVSAGKVLIYLTEVDNCRICTCSPPFFPIYAAMTGRDDAVETFEFSVLPPASGFFDAEVGSGGRIWLLTSPQEQGRLTEVRELIAFPGMPISQSQALASDSDGAGYEYYFQWLTRLGGGFVLTEWAPGGYVASLRTGDGYEWERLPISSDDDLVLYAVPGPSDRVTYIVADRDSGWQVSVRFLSLGRSRGVSPVKRVRPSRPE